MRDSITDTLTDMNPLTDNCLFCRIVQRSLPTPLLLETDHVVAFADIQPQAPHHYLVIPRQHVAHLLDCDDPHLLGHVMDGVRQLAKQQGLTDFRTVMNTGSKAGQTVFHWHVHVLAGRDLGWPPG